ncbi:MAG: response regulator [Anaerolineae bacterium]|nr:response regulator [Anaerolineae bacterium]
MNIPKGSILVVEDMPHIRGLLEATLRFEGYPVESAEDGRQAYEMIKANRPALVISDILMPNMDGFALAYHLRKNEETRSIPIIFLSATYITKEDKDFALSLGAMKFMEKPVDTAEFLLTIGEIIAQGPDSPAREMNEMEFYASYRLRLENKLRQKNQQIARTKRLLSTLPDDQKPAFQTMLADSESHRIQIENELEEIIQSLKDLDG